MGALDDIAAASSARVGPRTVTDTEGGYTLVVGDPSSLVPAGLDLDTYALARMVSSEYGSGPPVALLALAEAAVNKADQRGVSVFTLLTHSSNSATDGRFGEQSGGHWASTRLDPTGRHVAAASSAIDGSDITGGAIDYFDPAAQDAGSQNGHKLRQSAQQYIQARYAEGLAWVGPIDGLNARQLMLFAPTGGYDIDSALAAASGSDGAGTVVTAGPAIDSTDDSDDDNNGSDDGADTGGDDESPLAGGAVLGIAAAGIGLLFALGRRKK